MTAAAIPEWISDAARVRRVPAGGSRGATGCSATTRRSRCFTRRPPLHGDHLCRVGLLFLVQPMFAKLALPWLGGSPSVWNTCVLFFQATLLLGYLYAHFSTRWLGVRRQIYCHLILLLAPLVVLPLTIGDGTAASSANPVWWLLWHDDADRGTAVFRRVDERAAPAALVRDAARAFGARSVFLYAASNLGSMLALLGYPLVLEPTDWHARPDVAVDGRLCRARRADGGVRDGGPGVRERAADAEHGDPTVRSKRSSRRANGSSG